MHSDFFGDNKDHGKGIRAWQHISMRLPSWHLQRRSHALSMESWDESADQDKISAYRRFLRLPDLLAP